ncbi:MAG: tail fiber protein [Clostridiaceae bacterium]|nr:tail fiber protein [Clostridiaceae bacterium]
MALYDGFFDAHAVGENEDGTTKYDRTYSAKETTEYFYQMIGSGVCIHNDPNSMQVRLADGGVVVHAGYLFIQGYWLKNDADYPLPVPENGTYAVLAHLNMDERIVELLTQPAADEYPDSLVLALVNMADGTVEDTRRNTDLCGVIDTASSLYGKIEFAIDFIEKEVKAKIEAAQAAMKEKADAFDTKMEEVQTLVDNISPAAVGTVVFTAGQKPGDDWLLCDGSFISEADYPELVELLGRFLPGAGDFQEYMADYYPGVSYLSSSAIHDRTVWTFNVTENELFFLYYVPRNPGSAPGSGNYFRYAKKPIKNYSLPLKQSSNVQTVLSLCDGYPYLAQWGSRKEEVILLEGDARLPRGDGSAYTEPTFTELDVASHMWYYTGTGTETADFTEFKRFIPKVSHLNGYNYMTIGGRISNYNLQDETLHIYYLKWQHGKFDQAEKHEIKYYTARWSRQHTGFLKVDTNLQKTLLAFHPKNREELLGMQAMYQSDGNAGIAGVYLNVYSETQRLFGATDGEPTVITTEVDYDAPDDNPYYHRYVKDIPYNILPICANDEVLIRTEIENNKLIVDYTTLNPKRGLLFKTIQRVLPNGAKLFPDSVVFAELQGIWFIFVGTGLLFTKSLHDKPWGYLDTMPTLGMITLSGSLEYDVGGNVLYISGVDMSGKPKMAGLRLPDPYSYADDGAWLPILSMDGIPAYIRAKEEGET